MIHSRLLERFCQTQIKVVPKGFSAEQTCHD